MTSTAITCLRHLPAPEGQLKVAQQFTAGYGGLRSSHPSPVGTTEISAVSAVPTGLTLPWSGLSPSDESLGYYRPSLRDEYHAGLFA